MVPNSIVIHHSLTADNQTVSWDAIRKYHVDVNGWADIGYHYGLELIGSRYEILLGRMPNEVGAHCKENGMNHKSIGICMVGNFDLAPPPTTQLALLTKLTKFLMSFYGIKIESVCRHSDFAGYKSCPGTRFPWSGFLAGL